MRGPPLPPSKETFQPKFPFLDYRLPVDQRVKDLVSRLTLEEKVGQMMYTAPGVERLGVPAYNWWNECLHGVARNGRATVFPQAIGMGATFDDSLILFISSAIGDEARAKFSLLVDRESRSVCRADVLDPECEYISGSEMGPWAGNFSGEDPYLSSMLGTAFVKGLQGDDDRYLKAAACAKHFVVHSGPEEGFGMFSMPWPLLKI